MSSLERNMLLDLKYLMKNEDKMLHANDMLANIGESLRVRLKELEYEKEQILQDLELLKIVEDELRK